MPTPQIHDLFSLIRRKSFVKKKLFVRSIYNGFAEKKFSINVKIFPRNNVKESFVSHEAISAQNFAYSGTLCYMFRLPHGEITFHPFSSARYFI